MITAFLTLNTFQASALTTKSCDLSEKAARYRIVSSQTNNYAADNYTRAAEELRKQCNGGQVSEPQWHATQSINFPKIGEVEYGVWEAYCFKNKTGAELRKTVCAKIYTCITEAQPDEDIYWLTKKAESLRCETLTEDDQPGQGDKYPSAKGCYTYIGSISCHDKLDQPECSFVYTQINDKGERVTGTINEDAGYYPYGFIVTIPFAPIALPIMLKKSKDAAHKSKNEMIAQKCVNATVEQDQD